MESPEESPSAETRASADSLVASFNEMFGDRAVAVALAQATAAEGDVADYWWGVVSQFSGQTRVPDGIELPSLAAA